MKCTIAAVLCCAALAAGAAETPSQPEENPAVKTYTIVPVELIRQATRVIELQRAEIERLRRDLIRTSQPKVCI